MSERIHVLAQQLFGKSSVDECGLQEIKDLADRYPYFAPAQFLLLEKLKKENLPEYSAQLQKAVLYYHNPLEFEYFISSERFETEIDFDESDQSSAGVQDHTEEQFVETTTVVEEIKDSSNDRAVNEHDEGINIPHTPPEATARETEEEPAMEVSHEPSVAETTNSIGEENIFLPPKEEMTEPVGLKEENSFEPADVPEKEIIDDSTGQGEVIREETEIPETNEEGFETSVPTLALHLPNPQFENAELSFEPYHTVDYFASQGIKLLQEDGPKDRFSKQLKSFTEWLKTMKRLAESEISKNVDASSESKIQHLAEGSVHDASVVTEAMAEVWIKQGNKEKAIETYNKLGLLNPSKKAYFAALIENLKHS